MPGSLNDKSSLDAFLHKEVTVNFRDNWGKLDGLTGTLREVYESRIVVEYLHKLNTYSQRKLGKKYEHRRMNFPFDSSKAGGKAPSKAAIISVENKYGTLVYENPDFKP